MFYIKLILFNSLDIEYLRSNNYALNQLVLIKMEIISLIQEFVCLFSLKSPSASLLAIVNILKENLEIHSQNNQNLNSFIEDIKEAVSD